MELTRTDVNEKLDRRDICLRSVRVSVEIRYGVVDKIHGDRMNPLALSIIPRTPDRSLLYSKSRFQESIMTR